MRKEKGITLVALIITVIILLVLATVSINLVINSGIISKTKYAVDKYSAEEIKERIGVAINAAKMKNLGFLTKEGLEEALTNEFGEGNFELLVVGEGYLIVVNDTEYLVDKDGKVGDGTKVEDSTIENAGDLSKAGQYNGETEDTAYKITCIEDLVEWTNNYNNYKNSYIVLEDTLDFNSTASYKNPKVKTTDINGNGKTEELITELTTAKGFKPISSFSGTFDGKNNEIKNIYENKTGNAGLFITISDSKILNLGVNGKIIGTSNVGGITGTRGGNTVNINKCYFSGYLKGDNAGGIIGSYPLSSCKAIIDECYNLGNIEGKRAGGIIGDECICTIINSYNVGNIKGTECAGGILGVVNGSINVYNSYNTGNIISDSKAGGIIGWSYSGSTIKNVYNTGNINPIGTNNLFTKVSWVTVNTDNGFYIDSTEVKGTNVINDTTTSFNKDYIKSQELVSKLNEYVNTYNEEHKNDEDFVSLRNWKYNEGSYPTFE